MLAWTDQGPPAWWHHLLVLDPLEQEKMRRHQMMALARYGRQPLDAWWDRDVSELRAWYGELKELLEKENAASCAVEDG